MEVPLSGEVTFEPESSQTQQEQETEDTEQLEYTLAEEEDLEAARVEAEQPEYMFQQPTTVQPSLLKKSSEDGKQPQFQAYSPRSEDGN